MKKISIVTGGTSGLGLCMARHLVKQGKNVVIIGRFCKTIDICEEEIDQVLDANLKGMVLMTVAALKTMTSYGGKIANIMSTASLKGKAGESLYCASKWGAKGFTEALKSEYKGSNILVYGVYPGGMKTSFWKETSSVKTDDFMEPEAVAEHIVDAVMNETIYISDIVIERK